MEKENDYWKTVIWSDETKIEFFGHNAACHAWNMKETAYDRINTIPTVKHGGGSIIVWAYFTLHGTGALHIIDGMIDFGEDRVSSRVRSVYSKNASGRSNRTTTLSTRQI